MHQEFISPMSVRRLLRGPVWRFALRNSRKRRARFFQQANLIRPSRSNLYPRRFCFLLNELLNELSLHRGSQYGGSRGLVAICELDLDGGHGDVRACFLGDPSERRWELDHYPELPPNAPY